MGIAVRSILLLLLIIVSSCTTVHDSYYQPKSTELRQRVQEQYQDKTDESYKNRDRVIKKYPPPKSLEEKKSVFSRFASFPPVKVALLVPLSGRYKELGQNMLDSAQLALFGINEPNLILVPIDTKGTSYGAVEAVNSAVENDVNIILGPIFSKSAQAISQIAKENNISVVSFSNDKALEGKGIFAMGFRPEQQIRRIVEFSIEKGIEDFAGVLPNNAYGAAAAKEMRNTVTEEEGSSVIKTEIFITDKSGKPKRLKSHVYSAFDSLMNTKPPKYYNEELKKFSDEPIKFPRALLIPQGGDILDSVSDMLTTYKHDPEKIKLLGTSNWYKNDNLLENPVLEGSWFAAPPKERRDIFESKFKEIYGYEPNELASLAYDGIALTATIARITKGTDFSASSLSNPRGFVGIDGIFRFKENGLTERGLEVVEIWEGKYYVVSPAPKNFFEIQRYNEQGDELEY
jgi:branched-chain amino acid transport system substrate-binding protein